MCYLILYYINIYIKRNNSNKGAGFVENYLKGSNIVKKECIKNVVCFIQKKTKM